jgi:hypothetical protein
MIAPDARVGKGPRNGRKARFPRSGAITDSLAES